MGEKSQPTPNASPGAPAPRVLAIGDIHGCSRAFDTLLAQVAPRPDDSVVILGDFVDRGPDTRGVLDRLIRLAEECKLVALLGNHEQMMLEARTDRATAAGWLGFGGQATLDSYAEDGKAADLAAVPARHWEFLETRCIDWCETKTHIFVHAGAAPDRPMNDQSPHVLRWEKFTRPRPHQSGKIVVCGHTHQESGRPRNVGHAICIDTWVYGAGWLSCLDVVSGRLWQASQQGESRQSCIDDYLETETQDRNSQDSGE